MEKIDCIGNKSNENLLENSNKKRVIPLPRSRLSGNEKEVQDNRMQRIRPGEDEQEEEEEEEEEDEKSAEHLVNLELICAACHLSVTSSKLQDNNIHRKQALACSQGHLLCHRCVQRFAIQSDTGCLLCAAEFQPSASIRSRSSSSNYSLENVRSKISVAEDQSVLQETKVEELHPSGVQARYPSLLPIPATRISCYEGLNRNAWIAEYGDHKDDRRTIADDNNYQLKNLCDIIKKDEEEVNVSNLKIKVNGQMLSECSRRPIKCPRLDCSMTVALSALTHHFLFDHSEVPVLSVEPGNNTTLIISFAALNREPSKCLALLLVSDKLSGSATNLFNGNHIHARYRNRLPLTVLAARLEYSNQYENLENVRKLAGEGHSQGNVIIAWVAGLDLGIPLRCSIQVVDSLESGGNRSLTYSGPINSLRITQKPHQVLFSGDCLILHQGLINQVTSGCSSLNINVTVH